MLQFLKVKGVSLILGLVFLPFYSNGLLVNLAGSVGKMLGVVLLTVLLALSVLGGACLRMNVLEDLAL